jgi:hypothetical protein
MSKPRRQEVDYFPHYCDHGKILFVLETNFQNDGYAVFYKIQELLAKTNGHCYDCSSSEGWEYLLSKMNVGEDRVLSIIKKLVTMGTIDRELWESRRVWMQSFVDSVADAYSRRKVDLPSKPVMCPKIDQLSGIDVNILPAQPDKCQHLSAKESKVKESKEKKRKETPLSQYSDEFETFWKAYPKKVKKDNAWAAWKKRNGTMPPIDIIVKAIETQKKCSQWIRDGGQYIPHPATWINGGQWMDEEEAHPLSGKVSDKTIQNVEMLKEWRPPT